MKPETCHVTEKGLTDDADDGGGWDDVERIDETDSLSRWSFRLVLVDGIAQIEYQPDSSSAQLTAKGWHERI